jgi:hypothetical protein
MCPLWRFRQRMAIPLADKFDPVNRFMRPSVGRTSAAHPAAPEAGRSLSVGARFPACRSVCQLPVPHGWPRPLRRDSPLLLVQLIRSALSVAIAYPADVFTFLGKPKISIRHQMARSQATARFSVVSIRLPRGSKEHEQTASRRRRRHVTNRGGRGQVGHQGKAGGMIASRGIA